MNGARGTVCGSHWPVGSVSEDTVTGQVLMLLCVGVVALVVFLRLFEALNALLELVVSLATFGLDAGVVTHVVQVDALFRNGHVASVVSLLKDCRGELLLLLAVGIHFAHGVNWFGHARLRLPVS